MVAGSLLMMIVGCVRPSGYSEPISGMPKRFDGGTLPLEEYWRLKITLWPSTPHMVATRGLVVLTPLVPQRFILRALGVRNGHDEWQVTEEGFYGIRALAADQERIFVGRNRNVVAYQASDGQLSWSMTLNIPDRTGYSFRVTSKLQVYVHPGDSSEIYNLDTASGDLSSVSRVHSIPDQEARILESDSQEYRLLEDRGGRYTLRSVDTTSGQLNWEWAMPSSLKYTPEIIGQRMFLNFGTEIVDLDLSKGRPAWSMSADTKIVSNLALGEHSGCFLQKDAILTCLDLTNGNTIGQVRFHPAVNPSYIEGYWVLVHEEMILIYFGDSGEIVALGPLR